MEDGRVKRLKWIIIGVVGICVVLLAGVAWHYESVPETLRPVTRAVIKGGGLPPGCTCHSKEQPLVSMHNLFSIQDCRQCHKQGEQLIGKKGSNKMTKERLASLQKRIKDEKVCQECHKSGGQLVVQKKKKVSGRMFCPVEQKTYNKEQAITRNHKYYCPKDKKTELIDVDEIAMKSAKEPKNKYCIVCHQVNKDLLDKHARVAKTSGEDIGNCLKCHTSHSKCEGCHW